MLKGEAKKEYARRWFQKNKARIIPARREYIRNWIANNKKRMAENRRRWKENNREKVRDLNCQWVVKNPDKERARIYAWRTKNPERNRMNNHLLHKQYKLLVIAAYGGHCNCCGENDITFLTIEHEKHDGQSHRKVKGVFYLSLIRRGFPKDEGLSVLCMNCNWATRLGKTCPHKKNILEIIG
jgi:HD superfamily phosphohydrolase